MRRSPSRSARGPEATHPVNRIAARAAAGKAVAASFIFLWSAFQLQLAFCARSVTKHSGLRRDKPIHYLLYLRLSVAFFHRPAAECGTELLRARNLPKGARRDRAGRRRQPHL